MSYTIHEATAFNDFAEVQSIIYKKPTRVHDRDKYGRTPLHIAISKKYMKIFRFLLDWGADPQVVDNFGRTILHYV